MERRERYDPEDIESLLTDRSFDELLDEERAFVLRHLSGRDEYERMRALLHYVRPNESNRPGIEPEDRVRANVLAAFRAQQQPQWRIWLNSLAAWAAPKEPSLFWRPALAFGSLALLILAGVVAVQYFGNEAGHSELAEVKELPAATEKKAAPQAAAEAAGSSDTSLALVPAEIPVEVATSAVAASADHAAEPPPFYHDPSTVETADSEVRVMEEPVATDAAVSPEREDVAMSPAAVDAKDMSFSQTTMSGAAAPAATGHVVTMDELVRNESLVNVSEVAKTTTRKRSASKFEEKAAKELSASRSLGQDAALLDLISSGW